MKQSTKKKEKNSYQIVIELFWKLLFAWIIPFYRSPIAHFGFCWFIRTYKRFSYIEIRKGRRFFLTFIIKYSYFKPSNGKLYWFEPGSIKPRLFLLLKVIVNYNKRRVKLYTKRFFIKLERIEIDTIENNYL